MKTEIDSIIEIETQFANFTAVNRREPSLIVLSPIGLQLFIQDIKKLYSCDHSNTQDLKYRGVKLISSVNIGITEVLIA